MELKIIEGLIVYFILYGVVKFFIGLAKARYKLYKGV
jgi:hypothetical protein